jgi:hypothetical protein
MNITRVLFVVFAVGSCAETALADYARWQHSGSLYILTTSDGADLPEAAVVKNFPLLVRLHSDWFDFRQANPGGDDIRFANSDGKPLVYQIEQWNPISGTASIWVRVPVIKGNTKQEIKLYWGNPAAKSESNGREVFDASNGYLTVLHMDEATRDETGTINATDTGTTPAAGNIGSARHFPGGKGIFGGDKIDGYQTGSKEHSTEAWFRPARPNGMVVAWGNEQGQGKVTMKYASPPHIRMDCYFSDGNIEGETRIPADEWVHVMHTYQKGEARLYVNGVLDTSRKSRATPLNIRSPARMWIGGWYNNFSFVGDVDEVRLSNVVRSADWIKLQYENQKPLQTAVGPVVQSGDSFSISTETIEVAEGQTAKVTAQTDGARKIYWSLNRNNIETIVAVDRNHYTYDAGRVEGNENCTLQLRAVYPTGVRTKNVRITIKEAIAEPVFSLTAPSDWDGRAKIEVVPTIKNLAAMKSQGASKLNYRWTVAGGAVIKRVVPGKLILTRSQCSGPITVRVAINNGGADVAAESKILVTEPPRDAWVRRQPENEKPVNNQFYPRDDTNEGTLYCNGSLDQPANEVMLKLFADGKQIKTLKQKPTGDNKYAFTVRLKAGLIKYKVDVVAMRGNAIQVLHTADNIVCGDAFIIEGQSNALATDTREDAPRETSPWIRSYGEPRGIKPGETPNLWCNPVWKFAGGQANRASRDEHKAVLGWWGMELAKRLVRSHEVPICIINGAAGGTRIDQHQRNSENPEDLSTIYGRLLWRVRQARLTHGIRAVLWHQGENDQGAAGPDGGYGWESYERYFVEMSAAWKEDFPNIQRYYVYQIFPNACSMGNGNGDMLREVQRTLPRLYSNMDIISTLGVDPPGGCHFPLEGWAKFASLVQPLIERDFYGGSNSGSVTSSITSPNLKRAFFTSNAKNEIALEFDQTVVWDESLINEFYLDGAKEMIALGTLSGNVVTLKLKERSSAQKITYLKEKSWSQKRLLKGNNGLAALTFCNVPIQANDPKN